MVLCSSKILNILSLSFTRMNSFFDIYVITMVALVIWVFTVLQLTEELSKVDEKLKLTESLLESKVRYDLHHLLTCLNFFSYLHSLWLN